MKSYRLPGKNFDLTISFPLANGVGVAIELHDKKGARMERWEKKIGAGMMVLTSLYRDKIEQYITMIFG